MAEVGVLEIGTEAEAWWLLEKTFTSGTLPIDAENIQLKIGPWPILQLKVEGAKFSSSLNPKMMSAFIDLQSNIYRTYGKLHYDRANGKALNKEEKIALELIVQVHPGSSLLKIDYTGLAKEFVKGAINKMEAKDFVTIVIAGFICWSSTTVIKGYIAEQTEQKRIEAQVSLSKEESHRLELMKGVAAQVPYVGINQVLSEEVINKIFKGAANAKSITIGGNTLDHEQVNALIRSERSTTEEVRLDGEYRIMKVDSSNASFFKVELQGADFKRFWAVLQDVTVTKEQNKQLLQEAEWSKKTINLAVNGKKVKGEITSATILDVKDRYLSQK